MELLLFMKSSGAIFFLLLFSLSFSIVAAPKKKDSKKKEENIFEKGIVQKPQKDSMVLRWTAVPFVKHYVLQIVDSRGKTIVKKITKKNSYTVKFSKEGKYRYRLSLINRMGRTELVTPWKSFEYVRIYIPEIHSLDPYEMYPRKPYKISVLGKNFNQRNKLVALQVYKEKEKVREGNIRRVVIKERLGEPIPLQYKVESAENLKIDLPATLLGVGNYKLAFLFRNRPLYLSKKPLFSIEPRKFISYLYLMPSVFYLYPNPKFSQQSKLLNMGYGMDIRWGTRLAKEQLELGFAGGFYVFTPSANGSKYITISTMLPLAFYFGYNIKIPARKVKVNLLFPYVDVGYDLYLFGIRKGYANVFKRTIAGIVKMNFGFLFMVEKNKLLFSMNTAAQIGFDKKFNFSGFVFSMGMGIRLEHIPKKKE